MSKTQQQKFELFATCAMGLEKILASELKGLNMSSVRPLASGVAFQASLQDVYRALLWTRTASRMLLVLGRVDATDADTLYDGCKAIAWERHLAPSATIAVFAKGTNSNLRNTVFTSMRVKDAICDACSERVGARPDVNTKQPDANIRVNLHDRKATIYFDLSGGPLHERGYRESGVQVQAPIKETLAAAILLAGDWPRICANEDSAFIDPFCGSGTLAIEAAMIAGDVAPGIQRAHWGVQGWALHDEEEFYRALDEADERAEAGHEKIPPIFGNDIDKRALRIAFDCAKRVGVADRIQFMQNDISDLSIETDATCGLIATNPPYGQRLLSENQLVSMEVALKRFVSSCIGFESAIICIDDQIDIAFGSSPKRIVRTKNGPLDASIRCFGAIDSQAGFENDERFSVEAGQFANRLAKMDKHRAKWARRTDMTCYRVYDADLPEFNVAIDVYQGAARESGRKWIHVSEYAAPKSIDPTVAAGRLSLAIDAIQRQFDVGASDVFLKRREKAKGGSQYSSQSPDEGNAGFRVSDGYHTVSENGHLFKVKFDGGLDTGIFLDTRDVRKIIEDEADGKRFLNLFAYTGSASVYAAAGNAKSTKTIDISQRYLDWARENMRINHLTGSNHEYVRADVIQWIADARRTSERFDLIYLDPPTFSNSKKMRSKSFDIQRDHVELLVGASRLLAPKGKMVFCCNLRSFKPDIESLSKLKVKIEDITARTIPADFERNQRIHHCYIVRYSK